MGVNQTVTFSKITSFLLYSNFTASAKPVGSIISVYPVWPPLSTPANPCDLTITISHKLLPLASAWGHCFHSPSVTYFSVCLQHGSQRLAFRAIINYVVNSLESLIDLPAPLIPTLPPLWPPMRLLHSSQGCFLFQLLQAYSCLRAFAFAIPSAWTMLIPDSHMGHSLTAFRSFSTSLHNYISPSYFKMPPT